MSPCPAASGRQTIFGCVSSRGSERRSLARMDFVQLTLVKVPFCWYTICKLISSSIVKRAKSTEYTPEITSLVELAVLLEAVVFGIGRRAGNRETLSRPKPTTSAVFLKKESMCTIYYVGTIGRPRSDPFPSNLFGRAGCVP